MQNEVIYTIQNTASFKADKATKAHIPTVLTEGDLEPLFKGKPYFLPKIIGALLIVALFLVQNYFPSTKNTTTSSANQTSSEKAIAQSTSSSESNPSTPTENNTTPNTAPVSVTIPNNTLSYDTLEISAPIIWGTNFNDTDILAQLQNGVAQVNGTAKPGERGVSIIFGHSSNYPWIKGSYNSVFAPLLEAKPGDTISLNYQNTQYTYTVTKSYEVKPTELSVMNDNSYTGIRLITCTPLGTNLRRLIVEAVQTQPNPDTAKAFTPQHFSGSIPEPR